MKVLILALSLGNGGVSRYIEEVSENLSLEGHQVVLLFIGEEERTTKVSDRFKTVEVASDGNGLLRRTLTVLKVLKRSRSMMEQDGLDVFMGNTPLSNVIGHLMRILSPGRHIKTLRTVHGMWSVEVRDLAEARTVYSSKLVESLLPLVVAPIERWELKRSDHIVAVSQQIKDYVLETTGRTDVHLITAGVNTAKFCPPKDKGQVRSELGLDDRPVLLFVGVICRRKGLHLLIDAVEKVLIDHPLQLVAVGGGPELDEYIEYAKKIGSGSIRFTGRIPDEELIKYYQAADIYCLTSTLEGMPQTLLEAMSSALPPISTDVGGISTLIDGKNGVLVRSGDIDQLSEGLTMLLADPERRIVMGTNARTAILETYSWHTICQKIDAVVR